MRKIDVAEHALTLDVQFSTILRDWMMFRQPHGLFESGKGQVTEEVYGKERVSFGLINLQTLLLTANFVIAFVNIVDSFFCRHNDDVPDSNRGEYWPAVQKPLLTCITNRSPSFEEQYFDGLLQLHDTRGKTFRPDTATCQKFVRNYDGLT
jgi:hypothetical protein